MKTKCQTDPDDYQEKTIERNQVIFDNVKFDESDPPPDEPWVRLAVRHLSRTQESLGKKGNRKFRVEALVMIQVFVPTEKNTMEGDAVAWAMAEVYDAENLIVKTSTEMKAPKRQSRTEVSVFGRLPARKPKWRASCGACWWRFPSAMKSPSRVEFC